MVKVFNLIDGVADYINDESGNVEGRGDKDAFFEGYHKKRLDYIAQQMHDIIDKERNNALKNKKVVNFEDLPEIKFMERD